MRGQIKEKIMNKIHLIKKGFKERNLKKEIKIENITRDSGRRLKESIEEWIRDYHRYNDSKIVELVDIKYSTNKGHYHKKTEHNALILYRSK